uniref:Phorbol-ester/DAG-type domain-containing protein n=1 Tax=Eptatretus burgeri TaxID=7764 RepID=A0A8C4Q076_EPTBU
MAGNTGKENEPHPPPVCPLPAADGHHESKLQRLKRSFSFKTRSLRSRSADNVFDRPGVETPSEPEPEETASRATAAQSPAHSPAKTAVTPGERQHDFHEYVFKKPTFCDMCNHMIVDAGSNNKYGLRCKACKLSIHHKCVDSMEYLRCMGKMVREENYLHIHLLKHRESI